jgi:hypothetical protein
MLFAFQVTAANYYSCENKSGNTVFSQFPCSDTAKPKTLKVDTAGAPIPIKNKVKLAEDIIEPDHKEPIVYRAKEKKYSCRKVSKTKLRNSRVSGTIIKCHTKRDVTSIHGKPHSIYRWAEDTPYDTKWTYDYEEKSVYVYFSNDLVTDWSEYR